MKRLSNRDAKVLLYFIGIGMLLLVYRFVYTPYQTKNETLESENNALQMQKNQMNLLVEQKSAYEDEINQMNQEIADTLDRFPAEVREEDAIVFAANLEEKDGIHISDISIGTKNLLYTIEGSTTGNVYSVPVTYTFSADYGQLKSMVDEIQMREAVENMSELSVNYDDSTGILLGTVTVNMFSMDDGEKEYTEPELPVESIGISNPFGTAESGK